MMAVAPHAVSFEVVRRFAEERVDLRLTPRSTDPGFRIGDQMIEVNFAACESGRKPSCTEVG